MGSPVLGKIILEDKADELRTALLLVLDCVDYTHGNCRMNEMVAAVLPKEIIERARKAVANG